MTILEAVDMYGTKAINASVGDTILSLVDRIYSSRDDVYFNVLYTLNPRYDWDSVQPGTVIRYLTKSACQNIYEITSK